jgi:hypothetical protein
MSTIRKVGSALKRAALYVPRRIASRLQNVGRYNYSELHLNPHTSAEEHAFRATIQAGQLFRRK